MLLIIILFKGDYFTRVSVFDSLTRFTILLVFLIRYVVEYITNFYNFWIFKQN